MLSVDTDRDVAGQRDATYLAALIAEIGDSVVLGRAVVPDGDITELPVPPNRVLQPGDPVLEDPVQRLELGAVEADEVLGE